MSCSVGKKCISPFSCSLNNKSVNSSKTHKHLRLVFDSRLSYEDYIKSFLSKINTVIGLLQKFQPNFQSLITIYKSFIRPHLDYGDVIYDRAKLFRQSLYGVRVLQTIKLLSSTQKPAIWKLFPLQLKTNKILLMSVYITPLILMYLKYIRPEPN